MRTIYEFNDLREDLSKVEDDFNGLIEDLEFANTDVDMYSEHYEDTENELNERLDTLRKLSLRVIFAYNYLIERFQDDLEERFTYQYDKKKIEVEK